MEDTAAARRDGSASFVPFVGMDATVETHSLTKRYGRTVAVDGLSIAVRPGQVTGFVGPNGAGKTTTMQLLLGLAAVDSGEALIEGRRYATIPRPLTVVGALLDARAFHPSRSARSHLRWLAQSNGIARSRVDEVLRLVGLANVARRRAGAFSLGMRQRLGIAAALLGDPPILILDEPTIGLDPEGIQWMRETLRGLAAEGRTVFVSSHLMSELEDTADHLIVIGKGRLLADISVAELLAAATNGQVEIRTARCAGRDDGPRKRRCDCGVERSRAGLRAGDGAGSGGGAPRHERGSPRRARVGTSDARGGVLLAHP